MKNKLFLGIFCLFLLSNLCYAYPEFSYTQTSYDAGQVDIIGEVSSGTQVELYVNDNYMGKKDIIANPTSILLAGDDITAFSVPYSSTITFRNNDGRTYILNISNGEVVQTLNYGDSVSYQVRTFDDIVLRDEQAGTQVVISVDDERQEFNFSEANTYLIDGQNELSFRVLSPFSQYTQTETYDYTVNFDKYTNNIRASPQADFIAESRVNIKGNVDDSKYPLYYVLNSDPSRGNMGALIEVPLSGISFDINISGLSEGLNEIYFVSTDTSNNHIFTGLQKVNVTVDTIIPSIEFGYVHYVENVNNLDVNLTAFEDTIYLNGQNLEFQVLTDGVSLNYTFNGISDDCGDIENGSVICPLSLVEGENNLTIYVTDLAGNVNKDAHNIYFDNELPDIVEKSLEPEEMFGSKATARFYFQQIEGRTNKPNVKLTIFTLAKDVADYNGKKLSCSDFKESYIRNLGQLDNDKAYGSELNTEERQISILDYAFQQKTVTSDGSGKFDAIIGLKESNIDTSDVKSSDTTKSKNPTVNEVESENTICFLMSDIYGNVNVYSKKVKLDAGNTMWRAGEITTIPNTIYASEIELPESASSASSNEYAEFGMTVKFTYVGAGDVTALTGFKINPDTDVSKYSEYVKVDTSRMNWKLDKGAGSLLVYVPVQVKPLGIEIKDYPDSLDLGFSATIKYSIGDEDIPIDDKNPIYFQTSVDIESPYDHTKWLTPERIDKWIGYLNKSIEHTKKAVDWTGKASVVGVIACAGAKFMYGIEVAALAADDAEGKDAALRKMYMVCDRVGCGAVPEECQDTGSADDFIDMKGETFLSGTQLDSKKASVVSAEDDKKILAEATKIKTGKPCVTSSGKAGTLTDLTLDLKEEATTKIGTLTGGWQSTENSKRTYNDQCLEAKYSNAQGVDSNNVVTDKALFESSAGKLKPQSVNVKSATSLCYVEGAPKYDGTRCNFFGLDKPTGLDPQDNIIESIRCGCIPDTYSHLKNYLQIQESIKGCLQQAKIGAVEGSYCERLLATAVCDVATNILFKTYLDNSKRGNEDGEGRSFLEKGLSGLQEGDKLLQDRYKGTFMDRVGMSSEDIVNKVCLASLSGDWSVISDNILSAVDQNQVEPVFGPAFAESRLQGFNPYTGDLSIRYTFTYAVVSGGQLINTKVEFLCDSSQPNGDYCPKGELITSKDAKSDISASNLYVGKGAAKQDSVILTDTKARYRYNVLKLTHTYEVDGEKKTKVQTENIAQKGEFMLGSCYFSAGVMASGSGYSCDTLFTDDALASVYTIEDGTHISPKGSSSNPTFYPGNNVYLTLDYDVRDEDSSSQSAFDLAYIATCQGVGENAKSYYKDVISVQTSGKVTDTVYKKLFTIPKLGESTSTTSSSVSLTLSPETWGKFVDGDTFEIVFYNTDSLTAKTLTVKSVSGFSTIPSELESGQTIVVDINKVDAKSTTSRVNVAFDKFNFVGSDSKTIKIDFTEEVSNVAVVLVHTSKSAGKTSNYGFANVGYSPDATNLDFYKLNKGACALEVRILPSGQGGDAIAATSFKDYNPLGDDVQVDDKLKSLDYKSLTFVIGATPKTQTYSFEIVYPQESTSICLDEDNGYEFNIEYFLETSDNVGTTEGATGTPINKYYLGYKLGLTSYVEPVVEPVNNLRDSLSIASNDNPSTITMSFADKDISSLLGKSGLTAYFSYKFEDYKKSISKEARIPFYITFAEDCDDFYNSQD